MRIRCPKCRSVFEAAGPDAAGLIECPQCGQRLSWPPTKPKAGPETEADDLAPVRLVARPATRPTPRPPKRKSPGLLVGLAAGGATALGLVGVLIYMAVSGAGPPSPEPPPTPTRVPEMPTQTSEAPTEPPTPPVGPPAPRPVTAAEDLEPAALFARASPAVVCIEVTDAEYKKRGQGSGFLVSHDGMIVTNYHVMHVGRRALVRFGDSKTFPVTAVLAQDKEKDLAVLKIAAKGMPYLELLPEGATPKVGARAFAIGTPAGYTNTLSEGLVSGLREQDNRSVVQTTAPISSGSSGGPLLDARGRVLGVNTFVRVERTGDRIIENLNFAVSSDEVHAILAKADAAKADLDAAARGQPLDDQAAADLARAYELIGKDRLLDAAGAVQALAERYPENTQVRLLEGQVSMRMNFADEALKAFEAVVRLSPNEAEGHLGIGLAYSRKKQWNKAADALNRAVTLSPADPVAQRALGAALLELRRHDEALSALKESVSLDDGDPKAWMTLGEAYMAQELYTPAEDAFRSVLRLRPNNALAHARLALAAYRNGQFDEAMSAASTAVRIRPDLPDAYYVMGLLLHRAGKKKKLRQVTDILKQIDPERARKLAEEIGIDLGTPGKATEGPETTEMPEAGAGDAADGPEVAEIPPDVGGKEKPESGGGEGG